MSQDRDGLARSVQVKLARHAKEIGADPNLVLTRYAIERFLYRLSRSGHANQFVLKGALLMLAWMGEWINYPALLDSPRPRLRAYTPATVIAEKLHAIAVLGMRNSRMKDYFDLHSLVLQGNINVTAMTKAISATFTLLDAPLTQARTEKEK